MKILVSPPHSSNNPSLLTALSRVLTDVVPTQMIRFLDLIALFSSIPEVLLI